MIVSRMLLMMQPIPPRRDYEDLRLRSVGGYAFAAATAPLFIAVAL
jgi:hypothetical protein